MGAHGVGGAEVGVGSGLNPWAGLDVSNAFGEGVHAGGADAGLFGDGGVHSGIDLGTHPGGDIIGDMLHS